MNSIKKIFMISKKLNIHSEFIDIRKKQIITSIILVLIMDMIILCDKFILKIGSFDNGRFMFVAPVAIIIGVLFIINQLVLGYENMKIFDKSILIIFTTLQIVLFSTQRDMIHFFMINTIFLLIITIRTLDIGELVSVFAATVVVVPFVVLNVYATNPIYAVLYLIGSALMCYFIFELNQAKTAMIATLLCRQKLSYAELLSMTDEYYGKDCDVNVQGAESEQDAMRVNVDTFTETESVIFLIFNHDRIFYYNRAFELFYGKSLAGYEVMKLHDFIEKKELYKQYTDDLKETDDFKDSEFVMKRYDGSIISIQGYICENEGFQYMIAFETTEEAEKRSALELAVDMYERIYEIHIKSAYTNSADEVIEFVLTKIRGILPKSNSGCFLKLSDDNILKLVASYGLDSGTSKLYRINLKETYIYEFTQGMLDHAVVVSLIDFPSEYEFFYRASNNRKTMNDVRLATISAPLYVAGRFYGYFNFDTSSLDIFDKGDLDNVVRLVAELEKAISIGTHNINTSILSNHDTLTGLLNKRSIDELFVKTKDHTDSMIFVLIKIENIKEINDRYTYKNGDRYILRLVDKLGLIFDESAYTARYSGDEIAVIEVNASKLDVIERLDILKVLLENDPVIMDAGLQVAVGFKYAVMKFPEEGISIKTLYEGAITLVEDEDIFY